MAVRKKRSVSLPPELDARIEAAAAEARTTFSGWLAEAARKEFTVQAGLGAVAEWEAENGPLSEDELAEGERWARGALRDARESGPSRQRSA